MGNSSLKGLDSLIDLVDELPDQIDRRIKTREADLLGEKMKNKIQARSIDGMGVENGIEKQYKPLKKSTINSRTIKNQKGLLSPLTTPSTSNQIETGKLIEDMTVKVKDTTITIAPSKERKKVAGYQEEMGRKTFSPTKEEADWLEEEISKIVEDEIRDLASKIK